MMGKVLGNVQRDVSSYPSIHLTNLSVRPSRKKPNNNNSALSLAIFGYNKCLQGHASKFHYYGSINYLAQYRAPNELQQCLN